MRLAMGIEYDGTGYSGWQIQIGQRTVQGTLEKGLSKVANHPVKLICAGRTDTGVHAIQQIVHFDTTAIRKERSWVLGTNVNIPSDVSVNWAKFVDENFHARYSAIARKYRYIILNRSTRSALHKRRATWIHWPLAVQQMHIAAQALVGEHDFSSFRAVACQSRTAIREIYQISVSRKGEYVFIDVIANAFLHHMVRNIAGVLIAIGKGEKPVSWVRDLLEIRNRRCGGVTAEPEGLYLIDVVYPHEYDIPVSFSSTTF